MTDKSKKLLNVAGGVGIAVGFVKAMDRIKSSISEYVEAFATLDDAMAAVKKVKVIIERGNDEFILQICSKHFRQIDKRFCCFGIYVCAITCRVLFVDFSNAYIIQRLRLVLWREREIPIRFFIF